MKFFFDRNLSPHLAMAVDALCKPDGHSAAHHDALFSPMTPDVDWINHLAADTGWAVITQDRLTKNAPERQALKSTGLLVFILSKQWSHTQHWDKAAAMVRWMPELIKMGTLVSGGAYMVPFKITGKGKLDPVNL